MPCTQRNPPLAIGVPVELHAHCSIRVIQQEKNANLGLLPECGLLSPCAWTEEMAIRPGADSTPLVSDTASGESIAIHPI